MRAVNATKCERGLHERDTFCRAFRTYVTIGQGYSARYAADKRFGQRILWAFLRFAIDGSLGKCYNAHMQVMYPCHVKCAAPINCRRLHRPGEHSGRAVTVCALLMLLVLLNTVLAAVNARFAETPGDKLFKNGDVTVDYTNASLGYVCVKHASTDRRVKVRISRSGETDTYDLASDGEYDVFPLKHGSGTYTISVYINVSGVNYAQEFGKSIKVKMDDDMTCWLYPNQYIWFTEDTKAIALADELCEGLTEDMDKIKTLYAYVKDNILYDYAKAFTVKSDYLPDVDSTLDTKTGICFDYASLLACMLRSQGIPAQLVKGYLKNDLYHAWNRVYVNGEWRMLDATFAGKYKAADYKTDNSY